MKGDLQLENQLLRPKRATLNVVGNLPNLLFDILDSKYTAQISNTLFKNHMTRPVISQSKI